MARFRWDDIAVGEDGMPEHLPIPVTADGQGPENDATADHYVCWCRSTITCPLTTALLRAGEAGRRWGQRRADELITEAMNDGDIAMHQAADLSQRLTERWWA